MRRFPTLRLAQNGSAEFVAAGKLRELLVPGGTLEIEGTPNAIQMMGYEAVRAAPVPHCVKAQGHVKVGNPA